MSTSVPTFPQNLTNRRKTLNALKIRDKKRTMLDAILIFHAIYIVNAPKFSDLAGTSSGALLYTM